MAHDHFYRRRSVGDKTDSCIHCGVKKTETGKKSKALNKAKK